ncbi:MAG: HDOD domain-containing protein [Betaproteobacteria bacterium]|nr:HDOD domain-containing protein [Betaproteobacteria bacterium]
MPHTTPQFAPQTIGRFEVLRELGRGAQSVVYLCSDPHLQREVAIKTLHFSAPEQRDKQSLLAEARTVSKLRHPNIVPIFEAGEQDNDPYLVFEYVEGGNLSQLLRSQPLTPVRAAEITLGVLDALAEAHGQGIIHRDLKPSNILIDAKGTPRVMDFGIAVRVADQAAEQEQGLMGSPAYMSPEYVDRRTVNARTDLYAVGLILLEMLTGKRLRQSEALLPLLARIVREPVQLPADLQIDERLAAIILKAVAHDPQLRFENAQLMKQALTAYLDSGQTESGEGSDVNQQSTLDFLLRRMRHKSDFPALSDSVSSINKLTDSDKESITKLSDTILKDFSLTNKILRLVNSAFYRQAGGGSISTVSRAVIVLGFDAIRNIAVTVLLFEHLQNKANANLLKEAFLRANLSGLLARDISKNLLPRDAEEAFICALFQGLGRLLAQYYFPDEIEEVRKLVQQGNAVEEAAVRQVLGISFEELGIGIARTWGFPATIVNSMRRIPPGTVAKPNTREESLRVVAGMSNELCGVIADAAPEERAKSMKKITDRYLRSLPIGGEQLQETMQNAFKELSQVAAILHVNLKQSAFARQLQAVSGEKGTAESDAASAAEDFDSDIASTVLSDNLIGGDRGTGEEAVAAGTPEDAHAILAAGIQDISNSLVENFSLNDVLRITLETMYRAVGFKRVLFCLRDPRAGQMTGRFGFGPSASEIVPHFRFPLGIAPDVFRVATTKGVDIIIENINDEKIKDRIPAWYRKSVPAETFVLFPLMLKGAPVGLIYCDKDKAGEIVIPAKELSLLKTLRNQALLAIKQAA